MADDNNASEPAACGFAAGAKPQAAGPDRYSPFDHRHGSLKGGGFAMSRPMLACTLCLALGLVAPAAAAQNPDVVIPRLAKVQDKVIVEGNSDSPYIWVAYDGYRLLKEPDGDEPSGAA